MAVRTSCTTPSEKVAAYVPLGGAHGWALGPFDQSENPFIVTPSSVRDLSKVPLHAMELWRLRDESELCTLIPPHCRTSTIRASTM